MSTISRTDARTHRQHLDYGGIEYFIPGPNNCSEAQLQENESMLNDSVRTTQSRILQRHIMMEIMEYKSLLWYVIEIFKAWGNVVLLN